MVDTSNSSPPSESLLPSVPRRTTNGFFMPDPPRNPLETVPTQAHESPHGNIPNTPLSVATVAAGLAIVFTLGAGLFISGGVTGSWWATYHLGFFMAAWSFFHWAEFAVTAGWNREKLSVDCKYPIIPLNNCRRVISVTFLFSLPPRQWHDLSHCTRYRPYGVPCYPILLARLKIPCGHLHHWCVIFSTLVTLSTDKIRDSRHSDYNPRTNNPLIGHDPCRKQFLSHGRQV